MALSSLSGLRWVYRVQTSLDHLLIRLITGSPFSLQLAAYPALQSRDKQGSTGQVDFLGLRPPPYPTSTLDPHLWVS